MNRIGGLVIALALFGACDLTEARTRTQRGGLLRVQTTDSIVFNVPDTVNLSTNFDVSVNTYGGGCETKGPTNLIKIAADSAEFRPLDITEVGDEVCTTDIKTFAHTGTLQFGTAGRNSVTVFGRDADGTTMQRTRSVHVKAP